MIASVSTFLTNHVAWVLALPWAVDPVPDEKDVKPGWTNFIVIALLIGASVLLWFSMRKQIRKIQVPREGEEAATPDRDEPTSDPGAER